MDPIEGKEELESQVDLVDQPVEEKKSKKSKKDKKSKKSRSRRSTISKEPSSTSLENKESKEPMPFSIRDTLTPKQIEILDEMKQQIEPELKTNYERKWCSEMCYVRYSVHASDSNIQILESTRLGFKESNTSFERNLG